MFKLLTDEANLIEQRLRMIQFDLDQARTEAQRLRLIQSSEMLSCQLNRIKMKLSKL